MKVNPFHVLVRYEYEAKDIYRLLQDGHLFFDLATRYSVCPSGKLGGDLGLIDANRLDEDFYEAYKSLEPGTYSEPIRTKFGWHLLYKKCK